MVYVHNRILFIHEKGGYLVICDNMNGPWTHYAKRDKSDRERQVLYDTTSMCSLNKLKL